MCRIPQILSSIWPSDQSTHLCLTFGRRSTQVNRLLNVETGYGNSYPMVCVCAKRSNPIATSRVWLVGQYFVRIYDHLWGPFLHFHWPATLEGWIIAWLGPRITGIMEKLLGGGTQKIADLFQKVHPTNKKGLISKQRFRLGGGIC